MYPSTLIYNGLWSDGLVQEALHLSFMCTPRPTSSSCSKCALCSHSRSRPDRTAIELELQDRTIYTESTGAVTSFPLTDTELCWGLLHCVGH